MSIDNRSARLQACKDHLAHCATLKAKHRTALKPLMQNAEMTFATDPAQWAKEALVRAAYQEVLELLDCEIKRTQDVISNLQKEKVS